MKNNFGDLLAQARRAKRITLRKLGQLIDLSPSFLSEIETGRRMPPKDEEKIKDLAIILDENQDKFVEAARKERLKKDHRLFEKLFNADRDLAWGLCRAVEDATNDEVGEVFREALTTLKQKRQG